ncbi:uncharacterized protein N7506_006377 [Penicillium brevicompactum]|uniref:uncharacterized protein n=1 Tax=Penicillium brevicompactum TaxID=5074 RepID=UPI002540BC66|nr:uncharacterized protein N7506_006377 [Penicillium brevicompactum]KAJ5332594.1 hypothetical protein N7506_006377 [Penicillium brevicompactum]
MGKRGEAEHKLPRNVIPLKWLQFPTETLNPANIMVKHAPSKPRRAAQACFRCDTGQPTCSNCKTYAQDCKYVSGPERPRPTNARLSQLEAENEQLRQQLGREHPVSDDRAGTSHRSPSAQSSSQPQEQTPNQHPVISNSVNADGSQSAVSRIFISPNGDSSYHGLTSTLFDDAPTDRHGHPRSADPQVPLEHTRKQLMGEAAYQRQLEGLNMQHGKLDFDGVDPELGMHLLDLHWNRQHHSFLITYRPAFMRDMATGGPYFSKLLLNAIYFGASKFSNRPDVRRDPDDVRTAGWTFRQRVKELLGGALDRSEITTIQALLVMTSSLFALGDERSAAWLYAGTAFRMIIDLGMHVDATMLSNMRRLSDEDIEIRRRVFWGAFVVDKIQSLYQGRPTSLQDFDTNVSLTFLDHYEELENWKPFAYTNVQSYPGSPAYSVSTFTELCKLSLILNGILNKVYSERSSNRSPEELLSTLRDLDAKLDGWHKALPDSLRFGNSVTEVAPPPHVLSLLALYNVLLILLHRPFVAEGHLHTTEPSIAISSFTTCTAAAARIVKILQAYDHAFSIMRAPYLISYATYVAATIYVRVAAQQRGGSRAHSCLRTCLEIFQKNQETNWAVRRAKNVILHLMDRMEVDIGSRDRPRVDAQLYQDKQGQLEDLHQHLQLDTEALDSDDIPMQWTPPETEASELDMDMIIQSFIRQNTRQNESQNFVDSYNASDTHDYQPAPGELASMMLTGHNGSYFDAQTDDDMLFGFNGSIQDSLLYH